MAEMRNDWREVVTVPPASLPVSLDLVKQHLKISNNNQDEILTLDIEAATECFEAITGMALIDRTIRTVRNGFSNELRHDVGYDLPIILATRQVNSVVSFQYVNSENTPVNLLENTDFYIDNTQERTQLRAVDCWPHNILDRAGVVSIEYVAGFGPDDTFVPSDIKNALLQHVAALYSNRGDCVDCGVTKAAPAGTIAVWNKYKLARL